MPPTTAPLTVHMTAEQTATLEYLSEQETTTSLAHRDAHTALLEFVAGLSPAKVGDEVLVCKSWRDAPSQVGRVTRVAPGIDWQGRPGWTFQVVYKLASGEWGTAEHRHGAVWQPEEVRP